MYSFVDINLKFIVIFIKCILNCIKIDNNYFYF